MILDRSVLIDDLLEPVGTCPAILYGLIETWTDVVLPIVRSKTVHDSGFILNLHELIGVQQSRNLIKILETVVSIIGDRSLSLFSFLGGDEDDTVCRPCSVDRG